MLIGVKLTPRAKQNKIHGTRKDAHGRDLLLVSVTAPADKNKANEALIALLAEHFDVPKSAITLVRGHTDRVKWLEISK